MSIPHISPYPLPADGDLPCNKVMWRLESRRAALLIHDMQRYFVNAFPGQAAPIGPMISNIAKLRDYCIASGIPIVYTAQPPKQNPCERGLLTDFWGPGLGADTGDEDIIPEVGSANHAHLLIKRRYSAFHGTSLRAMLRDWDRDQLMICGIYAHLGCLLTAADAFMADVQPFFVADAVADFSAEHHNLALNYAASRCAAVLTTEDAARRLDGQGNESAHRDS
jgi:bifunctional isochorismate lyase / aryl carrier protein